MLPTFHPGGLKAVALAGCAAVLSSSIVLAKSVPLAVFVHDAPVPLSVVQIEGKKSPAWQVSPSETAQLKTSESLTPTQELFLAITYLDRGYGQLSVKFTGEDKAIQSPEKFTHTVLADSGKWTTALFELRGSRPAQIPKIEINLEAKNTPLLISSVSIQDSPFTDPHFQYILAESWKHPYAGPASAGVDNQTLKGKIMVGYQGWFRTPNDPCHRGWVHWGDINAGEFTIDMWPDVSGYPTEALEKADDVKLLSGKPGYLFSSAWPEVVQTHFRWMRENQIDGVFVQRFLGGLQDVNGEPEWVLGNVRAAAHQEGRIWAVEYDVSGCHDDQLLATLKKDWAWLVDDFGIKGDANYAHESGKPVVFIWGMGVPDRKISAATANAVVDFFKNDPRYGGNCVIGGITSQWRKMDSSWQEHFRHDDGILPWMSKSYDQDIADFRKMGIDDYPHVWPGFSWANLKHLPTASPEQFTPRKGGSFYEDLFTRAIHGGADRLFVGMFDEYDEGTAIMPMSDDPPPTPRRPGTSVKFFPMPGVEEHAVPACEPLVKFNFDGSPPAKGVEPTNFDMRWEGTLQKAKAGVYHLSIQGPVGDSWSVAINGEQPSPARKISAGDSLDTTAVTVNSAGQAVIFRLDYHHASHPGGMVLLWRDASKSWQEIPPTAFVDAWGRFLNNEGASPNRWLQLTAAAKRMLMQPPR